jgi:hypothetical protein
MLAVVCAIEGGDQIGHPVIRRDDAKLETLAAQEITDKAGGLCRVTRRIWALAAEEALEESDNSVAILVDSLQKRLAVFAHCPTPKAEAELRFTTVRAGVSMRSSCAALSGETFSSSALVVTPFAERVGRPEVPFLTIEMRNPTLSRS